MREHEDTMSAIHDSKLAYMLREQGETDEEIASLLPALEALTRWKVPELAAADTQRLLSALAPLLPAHEVFVPRQSPVRDALERQQAGTPLATLRTTFDLALAQVGLMRPPFWIASAFISALGVLVLFLGARTGEATMLRALGPLLATLGVSAVFRSVRLRTLEIELSCPVSPVRLALIRLALVLGYDVLLGLILSVVLWTMRESGSGSSILALMLHWLAPLLAVSGVAVMLSVRLRTEIATTLSYALWLSLLALTLSEEQPGRLGALLESGEPILALLGVGLLAWGIARLRGAMPLMLPRG